MRTTAVTRAALLLMTLSAGTGQVLWGQRPARGEAGPRLVGWWQGTITIVGQNFRVVVKLATESGGLVGTLDSPDQGVTGLPLKVTVDGNSLHFASKKSLRYEGKVSADGREAVGHRVPMCHQLESAILGVVAVLTTPAPAVRGEVDFNGAEG